MPAGSYDVGGFVDGLMPFFNQMAKQQSEKQKYEQQLAQVEQWSKQGVKNGQFVTIDENVKDKDIIPFMNKKAIDDIKYNKSLSIAEKRGQLDATAAMARMNIQNELRRAAKAPTYPVEVPKVGQVPMTGPQAAQYGLNVESGERAKKAGERAQVHTDIAKQQAEGKTPVQQKRFDMADAKEQRRILEAQPEYKFQQKHGITPAKIMENPYEDYTLYGTDPAGKQAAMAWNITRDREGNLVGRGMNDEVALRKSAIMPPGYPNKKVPGTWGRDKEVPYTPEEVQGFQNRFYYKPNSPIYRVKKTEYSQTQGDDPKLNIKGHKHTIDPEGDIMSVHGQLMPMNEYEGIKQRALTMKESYLNKIVHAPGETEEDYNKRIGGLNQYMLQLGYDPKQFLGR